MPDSRGATWDRARGDFGADVGFLDAALAQTFRQCRVDPSRVALGGFSDGASYALSLGVGNGDLFTHLAAFSPGFVNSGEELVGKPVIFVSHGAQDPVLDVRGSRDQIVPLLQDAGYDVTRGVRRRPRGPVDGLRAGAGLVHGVARARSGAAAQLPRQNDASSPRERARRVDAPQNGVPVSVTHPRKSMGSAAYLSVTERGR
ncbi:MAG: hypothetical protein P8Z36_17880, partial [Gemmatimonadota bacterium]